jgi:ATP-binding cassette, subfamily B (MDR/TAP), member 7
VGQYDKHLSKYEEASIKIATSLAFLNSGQNIIFSSALTAMMVLAAQGIIQGERIGMPVGMPEVRLNFLF